MPNPNLKLLPGMTASITFQIEAKENVLRLPAAAAALRFAPLPTQIRPEDRHYVELPGTGAPTENSFDLKNPAQRDKKPLEAELPNPRPVKPTP